VSSDRGEGDRASRLADAAGRKAARKIAGRKEKGRGALSWAGTIGVVGFMVTLPMLLGIALGAWLDGKGGGKYSFTIMLMVGGLILGCVNAWQWGKRNIGGRDEGGAPK
jgi:ATP synthase protein I